MARVQPSPFNIGGTATPLGNWSRRGGSFAAVGAMPVRLPLRKNVGLRQLGWHDIVVVFLGLLALNWWSNVHFSMWTLLGGGVVYDNHAALRNFALAWAALAVFERLKRLDEEKRGAQPHTYSPGVTRLGLHEFLPLSPKVIAVAVEPALAFLSGAMCRRLGFSMLGWVIIASAVCFSISEWRVFEQLKEHGRDIGDMGLEAQWEADLMKQNGERKAWHGDGQTSGLATGIDGLEGSIGKRTEPVDGASAGGAL